MRLGRSNRASRERERVDMVSMLSDRGVIEPSIGMFELGSVQNGMARARLELKSSSENVARARLGKYLKSSSSAH